jgi:hypothetical protein
MGSQGIGSALGEVAERLNAAVLKTARSSLKIGLYSVEQVKEDEPKRIRYEARSGN